MMRSTILHAVGVILLAWPAYAGQAATTGALLPATAVLELVSTQGPLPTITRQASGPPTIRGVRIAEPLQIDGRLDEALYREVPAITDFVQVEPVEGAIATEKTELWIAFDRDNVYVSFRCWETEPSRVVAKEMRRDHQSIWSGDDIIAFFMDTFHDRRNGFEFALNSIGGRQDAQTSNERNWNGDWNTIWDFKTARFDGGWVVETAIPFKSLRYQPGEDQVWGFNAMRTNRWKNELSFLTPPPKARGQGGLHQASLAAQLVGVTAPSGAKNLEIKPYVISNATTSRTVGQGASLNDFKANLGADVKYGITQSVTADLTLNTDFAQVEADQQQVNLTRFSLFFPEKREFFLENQGTFSFGNGGGDTPVLFYSRRIGLERGQAVPLDVGGRLSGRTGRYSFGVLNIQTGADEAAQAESTNFSVVRVRRDILRRSAVGVLVSGRTDGSGGAPENVAYGVDGSFAFFANLAINTYWARSAVKGVASDDASYRAQLDYGGDRYGLQLERLKIGDNFNPGVGFVRRDNMEKSYGQVRFSPRPRASTVVRKYSWSGAVGYFENGSGLLESRSQDVDFAIEFQNADRFNVGYNGFYEYLPSPFRIGTGVTLPVGGYAFDSVGASFTGAQRRAISGTVSLEHGTFYNGHKTAFGLSGGRVNLNTRVSVEPSYSLNKVDLVQGRFTTHLLGSRITWTTTPLMFMSALLQYNSGSHAVSANVRLRWEYRPGSELFVVLNEERDTLGQRFPDLTNRAFIVKVNRLLRF